MLFLNEVIKKCTKNVNIDQFKAREPRCVIYDLIKTIFTLNTRDVQTIFQAAYYTNVRERFTKKRNSVRSAERLAPFR